MKKERLNFWQLWNMSFGLFGIQFGWALQMANTSAIFEHLGANAHQIPILWLAAPLTGLIIQPIIGNMSDNTWGPLGRRRPYFLVGAIFSSIALVVMPNSPNLWIAAGLLWILDTSANVSMEPFRAFVGDILPANQRTRGYAMQSFFIGIGAVIASALPWILSHVFHVTTGAGQPNTIPQAVKWSFYIGAIAFIGTVAWTVFTTEEYPPKDMEAFEQQKEERGGIVGTFRETFVALRDMPPTMRQLAWSQSFSWLGMYCVFLYFPPAVARNIIGAIDERTALYTDGIEWAGLCIAMYNAVCFLFSFVLPKLAKATSRKIAHTLCLICGGIGLISLQFIHNQYLVLLPMVGLGIAWASLLSMPYAILVGALPPKKSGIYMGIFNFFIVLPEVLASLGLGWFMQHVLDNNRLTAVVLGGGFMLIAAVLMQRVEDVATSGQVNLTGQSTADSANSSANSANSNNSSDLTDPADAAGDVAQTEVSDDANVPEPTMKR